MKTATTIRFVITLTVLALLTACGNTKSQSTSATAAVSLGTTSTLALCNKAVDSNFSFNTSIVTNSNGGVSTDYLKLKFNFVNANITKSGVSIRFYKWRVIGGTSSLDSTPLNVATYSLSTGQTSSTLSSAIAGDQLNASNGLYIQLNDPSAVYQVLKIVAYDSSGNVISSTTSSNGLNTLIPAFAANPASYIYNSDGSTRSSSLLQLHPLYGQTTTDVAAKANFDSYCF